MPRALMTSPLSEAEFELFRRLIKEHVGISFSRKKKGTLQRKLASRLSRLGLESYDAYYHYLLHDKKGGLELRQLINTITVDQTAFFRHAKQFEHLANIILPQIATQKETSKKLRIWSAGCATGEEAYSIAMVVNEIFEAGGPWDVKILASDIDTDALKFAYKGLYPRHCVEKVPSEYLNKYFIEEARREGRSYSVREALRKNMLFRRLNFMDPEFPFKSFVDIIFCRNVMIYFDQEIKKKLIDSFFHILEQDAFLCLGASESLIGVDYRFTLVGHAIYQKGG
jgi:chemotaxis protein methyltransferase CheR